MSGNPDEIMNDMTDLAGMLADDNVSARTRQLARVALKTMEQLNASIQMDARFGVEPPTDGTVIRFVRQFVSTSGEWADSAQLRSYMYAALRIDGRWWLTGSNTKLHRSLNWDELVEKHLRHAVEVFVVDNWVPLARRS